MRSARAGPPRNKEREAGVLRHTLSGRIGHCRSSVNDLPLINEHGRWQRSHGDWGKRHNGWDRRSRFDLTVRQRARSGRGHSVRRYFGAAFKPVVRSPHGPQARREMRIEVTMENRVAYDLVSIATAVVGHLQRVARTRANHLTVEIAAHIAVGRLQPLVRVLV